MREDDERKVQDCCKNIYSTYKCIEEYFYYESMTILIFKKLEENLTKHEINNFAKRKERKVSQPPKPNVYNFDFSTGLGKAYDSVGEK